MLKKLIEELAHNKISISTALTTAKVISHRFEIVELSHWLNSELNGYDISDQLPDYRKFPCEIVGSVLDGRGVRHEGYSIDLTQLSSQSGIDLYTVEEGQGIQNLEYILETQKGPSVSSDFPQSLVRNVAHYLPRGLHLISVSRKSSISYLNNILNQVKQRLLDLLLEIENKYPDAFVESQEIKKEVKDVINNMITYNLYGNHNTTPLAVGREIKQSTNVSQTQNNIDNTINELSRLGVESDSLSELKDIVTKHQDIPGHKTIKQKVMGWFGNLITKAAEKGIELEVPVILDKLSDLINGS